MVKERETDIPVSESSGNVFANMGLPEAEEELTRAQLASHIRQVITRRRLTQVAAAKIMGIDPPKVSALLNGRLANFSSERLMRLLTALGQDMVRFEEVGLSYVSPGAGPGPEVLHDLSFTLSAGYSAGCSGHPGRARPACSG